MASVEVVAPFPPDWLADWSRLVGDRIDLPDKDRPILLAALGAHAPHLLTGDRRHFGAYFGQQVGGVLILPPADYLRLRAGEGP